MGASYLTDFEVAKVTFSHPWNQAIGNKSFFALIKSFNAADWHSQKLRTFQPEMILLSNYIGLIHDWKLLVDLGTKHMLPFL
mgnify:CR=1 FL=1